MDFKLFFPTNGSYSKNERFCFCFNFKLFIHDISWRKTRSSLPFTVDFECNFLNPTSSRKTPQVFQISRVWMVLGVQKTHQVWFIWIIFGKSNKKPSTTYPTRRRPVDCAKATWRIQKTSSSRKVASQQGVTKMKIGGHEQMGYCILLETITYPWGRKRKNMDSSSTQKCRLGKDMLVLSRVEVCRFWSLRVFNLESESIFSKRICLLSKRWTKLWTSATSPHASCSNVWSIYFNLYKLLKHEWKTYLVHQLGW